MKNIIIGFSVFIISLVFLVSEVYCIQNESITFDEPTHLISGWKAWKEKDFSFDPIQPPLIREIIALPLLKTTPANYFNSDKIIFWPRITVALLSLSGGLILFFWVKARFSKFTALIAFFLYCFEPNILAHSHLATVDMGTTLSYFLTQILFWDWLKKPTLRKLVALAIVTGLALASKLSLLPFLAVSYLLTLLLFSKWKINGKKINLFLIFVSGALWLTYFFTIEPVFGKRPTPHYQANAWLSQGGLKSHLAAFGLRFNVPLGSYVSSLKELYLYNNRGQANYLFGKFSKTGWWYYFLVAYFYKTPIPLIILSILSIILSLKNKLKSTRLLVVPIIAVFGTTMFGHLNIGVRHILPAYPFLIIFAAVALTKLWQKGNFSRLLFTIFLIWYLASSLKSLPHPLSYFNEFAGSPLNYQNILIDSNLDWGQGLTDLKKYQDQNDKLINLAYWGGINPSFYGLRFKKLPSMGNCQGNDLKKIQGSIAISINSWINCQYYKSELKNSWPPKIIGGSIFVFETN